MASAEAESAARVTLGLIDGQQLIGSLDKFSPYQSPITLRLEGSETVKSVPRDEVASCSPSIRPVCASVNSCA